MRVTIRDPSISHTKLHSLDPSSHYILKVTAYTAAGEGPPIAHRGATLLEGGETWFERKISFVAIFSAAFTHFFIPPSSSSIQRLHHCWEHIV